MMKPTVHTLITVPKPEHYDSCTLALKTLRVGFPTADIKVHVNTHSPFIPWAERVINEVSELGFESQLTAKDGVFQQVHHAYWIQRVIEGHSKLDEPGPLYIVDGDCHFWKSCEGWTVPIGRAYMGYYVPFMWNDFAKCPSFPRLHTSLMLIPDTQLLLDLLKSVYPEAHMKDGDYCPCDPFMPATRYINRQPYFWDSCANLYQMIGGASFVQEHLECFEHLNSASFQEVMRERLPNKAAFEQLHSWGPANMDKLRGKLWPLFAQYYNQKHVQGKLASQIDA